MAGEWYGRGMVWQGNGMAEEWMAEEWLAEEWLAEEWHGRGMVWQRNGWQSLWGPIGDAPLTYRTSSLAYSASRPMRACKCELLATIDQTFAANYRTTCCIRPTSRALTLGSYVDGFFDFRDEVGRLAVGQFFGLLFSQLLFVVMEHGDSLHGGRENAPK